jgi:hypothetical protein
LANGTVWAVTSNGSAQSGTTPSSIMFVGLVNGTRAFSVAALA